MQLQSPLTLAALMSWSPRPILTTYEPFNSMMCEILCEEMPADDGPAFLQCSFCNLSFCNTRGRRDPLKARRRERKVRVGVPSVLGSGSRESAPRHTAPRHQEASSPARRRRRRRKREKNSLRARHASVRLGLAPQTTAPPSTPSPTFIKGPYYTFFSCATYFSPLSQLK